MTLDTIKNNIINDSDQAEFTKKGWLPLYAVSLNTKILIIGQAPGINTQTKNVAWQDLSGRRLRQWLGVGEDTFYNLNLFGQLPMDFYFPGKAKTGDMPPRKNFAPKWHPKIMSLLEDVKLIILIGNYAQKYYLSSLAQSTLTETVKSFNSYLPKYFPLPHPSPLNVRWFKQNPWFEVDVLPKLKLIVENILTEK